MRETAASGQGDEDAAWEQALAAAFCRLPHADDHEGAQRRLAAHGARRHVTLGQLWRRYLVCGFSLQEPTWPGAPADLFEHSNHPLLDLATVRRHAGDAAWVLSRIDETGLRRPALKARVLAQAADFFFDAQWGADTPLAALQVPEAHALALFADCAAGRIPEEPLAAAEAFAERLDPTPYWGIGDMQLRQVLVTTGLAAQVLPLDGRWLRYLARVGGPRVKPHELSGRRRYLALESLVRRAAERARAHRPDLVSLAVLDRLVLDSGVRASEWGALEPAEPTADGPGLLPGDEAG